MLSIFRALKITDCPMAAEGKYKCASHNDSTECELTVYARNKVLKELEDVSVAETEMATFECQGGSQFCRKTPTNAASIFIAV